ncbi:glycoside hydrolase family 3 N-terminal domain-containing protein [Leifsonia sp. Root4]|uniref:glycoside hydrolase family 3 protein n=1 Tax=Leifsonia sp. Root4 TaxID=1736525 RepID=UPI000B2FEF6B|nr:glycoside hydrolase family 3 N-terminal domain-containing protein [Leifsonia sp. Root4]
MTGNTHFPYQDPTLSPEQRADDLLTRMDTQDKAGLMFHPRGGHAGLDQPSVFDTPSTKELVHRRINHFNTLQGGSARAMAEWHNSAQSAALSLPLGIPVTFSTDPRHSFGYNPGTSLRTSAFSQWPEFLGFGAIDDVELTRAYADTVRREYLAVGIRVSLHPQIDLATDSRWARAVGTFGESADVAARHGVAYVEGLQGEQVGADSVSAMAKHFPGGGPQKDGEDPHFSYGREQIYPGGQFELHLGPFKAVIAAGVAQLMPYYGMPIGLEYEEVGFGFNAGIIDGLLRGELGFDGIVCADWSILSRNYWGVEGLTYAERMVKAIEAGVDQFGGETDVDALVQLIASGRITEARIDRSARRLLIEKFRLGLFESPYVDADQAERIVGIPSDREAGIRAQALAITPLVNREGAAHLPLARGIAVFSEGIDTDQLATYARIVDSPAEADVAIIRLAAPWDPRGQAGTLESYFHAGSLEFAPETRAHIEEIARSVPTVIDVYLDRPAILAPLVDLAHSLTVDFGAGDEALLQVIFGEVVPTGTLPFDVPSSMAAVSESRPDVPFDTTAPTFRFGDGLVL